MFGRFRLDAGKRLLSAGAEVVGLTPKAFDTLLALVDNRGRVVSKEELMSRVWAGQFVEENNLAQHIHAIRRSLGDGAEGVKYIETVPKRGYRFVAEVEVQESPAAATEAGGTARALSHAAGESTVAKSPTSSRGLAYAPAFAAGSRAAPAVPKTRYAMSTGGVNIAYQTLGDAPLDLVFVMGWVSHLEYFWREPRFARFLRRLASFSRL
ncbi:MAG TPA: transcriptional regulator, partial [Pyrinomonadaceae bacterium]